MFSMYVEIKYSLSVRLTNSNILLNSGCIIFQYCCEDLSQNLIKNCAVKFLWVYDNLKCGNTRDPDGMKIVCQALFH